MLKASGGLHAYLGALLSLWQMVAAKDTAYHSSPATTIARVVTIAFIYVLCFGAASVAPILAQSGPAADTDQKRFTGVWVAPALCFFSLIFLKFVNSGYLLLLSPPGCIWLGRRIEAWYGASASRKPLRIGILTAGAAANTLIFLAAPLYCSYRSVRRFETELASVRRTLPEIAPANSTIIVAFDSHFLGFRDAGYYLPDHLTIEYPVARLREGPRIFAMHDRDTRLLTGLPETSYSRFVLLPLPMAGSEYREYLQTVERRLPAGHLETQHIDGHEYVTGRVSDLQLLFSNTPSTQDNGVYALLHSAEAPVNSSAHPPMEDAR